MGAHRGTCGHLPYPAVPRREVPFEEVASSGLPLRSGDRVAQHPLVLCARTVAKPWGVRNPFGLEGYPWIAYAGYALLPLLPLCMLASSASLVMRYRRSGG